jgi:ribosomal protein S18 acetylase RimI-like enzyme
MNRELLFATPSARCFEMRLDEVPRLQKFFEENPEYDLSVNGEPPRPDEALEEFQSLPPADWPMGKKWLLAFEAGDKSMIGMADVISDLLVKDVWHIGLFIVSTRLHGAGVAQELYAGLEGWIMARGARWLRLGVVAGNARAERFWERLGYEEVRVRRNVEMGKRTNDVRVMVKPLMGGSVADYLALVARDRPGTD